MFGVVDVRESASAQDVAGGNVGELQVDPGACDASAGDVRKTSLPRAPELNVPDLGPEPPHAITDLADVVHAAFTPRPRARQLADIGGIARAARDPGGVG